MDLILTALTISGRSLDGGEAIIFTSDNLVGQSVSYGALPRSERREMQQEILTLLGLHHRPAPATHETRAAAPRYMMHLYKSLSDQELMEVVSRQGNGVGNHRQASDDDDDTAAEAKSDSDKDEVHDADVIMSFINHGMHTILKFCNCYPKIGLFFHRFLRIKKFKNRSIFSTLLKNIFINDFFLHS